MARGGARKGAGRKRLYDDSEGVRKHRSIYCTPKELEQLRRILEAIRDGSISLNENGMPYSINEGKTSISEIGVPKSNTNETSIPYSDNEISVPDSKYIERGIPDSIEQIREGLHSIIEGENTEKLQAIVAVAKEHGTKSARKAAEEIESGILDSKICIVCGKAFDSKSVKSLYCSRACQQKAYRARQREQESGN